MKNKILLGLGIVATLMSSAYAKEFVDVPADYWASSIIEETSEKGIIKGYEDGTFKPENLLNRAEFATIMTNVLKLGTNESKEASFADVAPEDWEYKFVEAVKDYFITYEKDGKVYFNSYEPAVREDVITALVKALKWDTEASKDNIEDIFADADEISENNKKYILTAFENGLVKGYEDLTINPKGSLTRAEAMALVKVLLKDETTSEPEKDIEYDYVFKINNQEIKPQEFELYLKFQVKAFEKQVDEGFVKQYIDEIKQSTLTSLVEMVVGEQKANERNIVLSDEDKTEIEKALIEDEDILKEYEVDKEDYRIMINRVFLVGKLREAIKLDAEKELDFEKYIQENPDKTYSYDVRHILFSTETTISEQDKANIEEKANEVLEELKAGTDFETLAKIYNEDPGSKETGGLYKGVKAGEMVEEFNNVMVHLDDGQLYEKVVETDFGYFIIKLEKKEKLSAEELEELKKSAVLEIAQSIIDEWFENIKFEINNEVYESIK